MSRCVSKYILDTTQNSVKVPYLKVFKILKVQILNEVALIQVVENGLVCMIPRTKIYQNFLAVKHDINQHSHAT